MPGTPDPTGTARRADAIRSSALDATERIGAGDPGAPRGCAKTAMALSEAAIR